jgi:hypothetical protein
MGVACSTHGKGDKYIQNWVGKTEEMNPLGSHRRRWEDNIRMDLREMGRRFVDWINLAQDRNEYRALVNTAMNFRIP